VMTYATGFSASEVMTTWRYTNVFIIIIIIISCIHHVTHSTLDHPATSLLLLQTMNHCVRWRFQGTSFDHFPSYAMVLRTIPVQ